MGWLTGDNPEGKAELDNFIHPVDHGGLGWVIYVRRGLSASQLNHAIARELAQWFLRRRGCGEAELEELAGRVAAAICVPATVLLPTSTAHWWNDHCKCRARGFTR
jgi:hypothetical protein